MNSVGCRDRQRPSTDSLHPSLEGSYIVDGEIRTNEDEIVESLILRLAGGPITLPVLQALSGLKRMWRMSPMSLRKQDLFDALGSLFSSGNSDVMFLAKKITAPSFGALPDWFCSGSVFLEGASNFLKEYEFDCLVNDSAQEVRLEPSVLRNLGKVFANMVLASPDTLDVMIENGTVHRMLAIHGLLSKCESDEAQRVQLDALPYESIRTSYCRKTYTILMGVVGLEWFAAAVMRWLSIVDSTLEEQSHVTSVVSRDMILELFEQALRVQSKYLTNETLKVIEWCLSNDRHLASVFMHPSFMECFMNSLSEGPEFVCVTRIQALQTVHEDGEPPKRLPQSQKYTCPCFFALGILKQLAVSPEPVDTMQFTSVLTFNPLESMNHEDIIYQFLSLLRRVGSRSLDTALQILDLPFIAQVIPGLDDFDLETKRLFAKFIGRMLLQYGREFHDKLLQIFSDYPTFIIECMQSSSETKFIELCCRILALAFDLSCGNRQLLHAFFEQAQELQTMIAESPEAHELTTILDRLIHSDDPCF